MLAPFVMSPAWFVKRVERAVPLVDEVAEPAVPGLVDDLRQFVAEAAHGAARRLDDHQRDDGDDDHDRQHEQRRARPPAPAQPPLHRGRHRREDGDAEDGDEHEEQDAPDRRERRPRRDDDRGHQDRPDRDRDGELAPGRVCGVSPADVAGSALPSGTLDRRRCRRNLCGAPFTARACRGVAATPVPPPPNRCPG